MRNKRLSKTIISIISFILLTTLSAAQDPFGDWNILQDGAELGAGLMDTLFWFEINTVPQAAMFLAVFAGFYFLSLKFVATVFDMIDDRLDMGSGGSYGLSDSESDAGKIEKGLSAALAFMITQYMGMLGLLLWVVIPSIFLIIFFLSTTKDLFGTYRKGSPETLDKAEEEIEKTAGLTEKVAGQVGKTQKTVESAIESYKEGAEKTADQKAEKAASQLQTELEEEEEIEKHLNSVLDTDLAAAKKLLNEDKKLVNIDKENEQKLEKIIQAEQQIYQELERARQAIKQGSPPRSVYQHLENLIGDPSNDAKGGLIQEINVAILEINNNLEDEQELIEEEMHDFKEELIELTRAQKIIDELEKEISIEVKDDEKIEKLAKELGDEHLYQEAEQEEGEEKQLAQKLQRLKKEESKIIEILEKADEELRAIKQLKDKEIQELQESLQDEGRIMKELEHLKADFRNKWGTNLAEQRSTSAQKEPEAKSKAILFGDYWQNKFEPQLAKMQELLQELIEKDQYEDQEIEQLIKEIEPTLEKLEKSQSSGRLGNLF